MGGSRREAWTEEAPVQERMQAKGWRIPDNAAPFFRNGIDWAKWEGEAASPEMYDPPQMKTGYIPNRLCICCNWWHQRSPLCASPTFPCCCATFMYRCCVRDVEYLSLVDPDDWMVRMLSTGTSPKCPDRFMGIFWLQDNIAAHEHLVTFHDADWATEKLALKNLSHNWTRGPTAFGAGLFCFVQTNGNRLRIELSPSGSWMILGGSSGNPTWIYIPSPEQAFKRHDGGQLVPDVDELQRVSFKDDANPNSGVSYQYRLRRIAYLDDAGSLVKTNPYEELKQAATMPLTSGPCCCGYCWCGSAEARAFMHLPHMPLHTVVKFAPPPPGARPP